MIGSSSSVRPLGGAVSQDCPVQIEGVNKGVINEQELAEFQPAVQPIQFHSMPVKTITTPGSTQRKQSVNLCTQTLACVDANTVSVAYHELRTSTESLLESYSLPQVSRSFSFCHFFPEMMVGFIKMTSTSKFHATKTFSNTTTVFNTDNNKKCFLSS